MPGHRDADGELPVIQQTAITINGVGAAKAKVGVMVGLGLDPWMEKLMKDAAPKARLVKVGNRKSLVATWQHIEYVIGFNLMYPGDSWIAGKWLGFAGFGLDRPVLRRPFEPVRQPDPPLGQ